MTVKTITLKGNDLVIRKEGIASVAITPGYLIERHSAVGVRPHNSAAVNAQKAFAVENDIVGDGIDVDYAIDDTTLYGVFPAGAEVFALVPASADAIVINDFLESAGDGTLRIAATDAATDEGQRAAIVAVALEAVDNSGGGSEARIKVEVM